MHPVPLHGSLWVHHTYAYLEAHDIGLPTAPTLIHVHAKCIHLALSRYGVVSKLLVSECPASELMCAFKSSWEANDKR